LSRWARYKLQNQAADDGIEQIPRFEQIQVRFVKRHIPQSMSLSALSGFGESRAVDIDTKDLSLLTNDAGGEKRHIAHSRVDVQDALSGLQAGLPKERLRVRSKAGCLTA
jgi:hypothetical protein